MASARWRILMALLVSGLVHGLIITVDSATPLPQPKLHPAGTLSLLLTPAGGPEEPISEPAAETFPAQQPAVANPAKKPVSTNSLPEPVREPKPVDDKPAEAPEATLARPRYETAAAPRETSANDVLVTTGPLSGARQAVQARLEKQLAEYFYYPLMARRRGWEGEVMLALRVTSRGRVDSVEIANSSGHKILDRAAVDAMAKVSLIPGTEYWLNGSELHLQLPIIYQLREG